jgi:hypothetical protein
MRMPKLVIVFTLGIVLSAAQAARGQSGSFANTGSMTAARSGQVAALLNNGNVLVAGSYFGTDDLVSAELYNPTTGTFTATGNMGLYPNSATVLQNGLVLITGYLTAGAELYNPTKGTFTATGNMVTEHGTAYTATLLNNGEVLVVGGASRCRNGQCNDMPNAELYNPSTGTFTATGNLNNRRRGHTATLLANGKVLIVGGEQNSTLISSAELYDPSTGTFAVTGSLNTVRAGHTANLLGDGTVLVAQGNDASAELYNPSSGTFSYTGSMISARNGYGYASSSTTTLLNDGTVLFAGGFGGSIVMSEAEIYSPVTGAFATTGSLNTARFTQTATLLPDGRVLVAGGENSTGYLSSTELYTPGAVTGYVNPKFVVVGVTYAPPGPSASTFVNYTNSTMIGTTNSISQSFMSGDTFSVSLSFGNNIPMVESGKITAMYSLTSSQKNMNTSTVGMTYQTSQGEKTGGTGSYWAPVDHDYDMVWVWLNPVAVLTVSSNAVVWNGYGLDATDQPGMDIVPIALGYLNGDWGPPPAQYTCPTCSFTRSWAANQSWPVGQGAALTNADYAQIAAADPFSVSTYGTNYLGYDLPAPETPDFRFTMSSCTTVASFDYLQANPSQAPNTYTCTLNYTNNSTQAKQITKTFSQTFSLDVSLSIGFVFQIGRDTKNENTLTWTTVEDSSISNSTSSTAQLSVQGPPCNNVVPEQPPCVPVYDSSGNQPTQFYVYEDNMFGTFMFAPVHYY